VTGAAGSSSGSVPQVSVPHGSVPLIGLAHGSRDPRSAAAIGDLMTAVAALRPGLRTCSAFLDLSEPDLTTVVARLDVERAVVVPLLFAQAFHATKDVPDAVIQAARRTGSSLVTGGILALGPDVLAALQQQARAAGVRGDQVIQLLAVVTSDPVANGADADLAQLWSSTRRGAVRAVFATCAPLATDVLGEPWDSSPAVVPLFLAPGLLLDQVARRAAELGVVVAEPLSTHMAQVVLDRYDAALSTALG
jgi:sirohydrochlorin cobaltochelatase